MKLRFLVDENLPPKVKTAIIRRYPDIDVLRVGDEGAPPLGTSDADILRYLQDTQPTLITDNRQSIPGHIADHFAENRHHWGIFEVHKNAPTEITHRRNLPLLVGERGGGMDRPC